jgi:hypothetical protein
VGAGETAPTACDGLEDRRFGITCQEYAPCAGEIVATLDTLQLFLQRWVLHGDSLARPEAERLHGHLRLLFDRIGFRAETFRELRDPGQSTERWPDATTRRFNHEISDAAGEYASAIRSANPGNLEEGSRRHERARREFSRFP